MVGSRVSEVRMVVAGRIFLLFWALNSLLLGLASADPVGLWNIQLPETIVKGFPGQKTLDITLTFQVKEVRSVSEPTRPSRPSKPTTPVAAPNPKAGIQFLDTGAPYDPVQPSLLFPAYEVHDVGIAVGDEKFPLSAQAKSALEEFILDAVEKRLTDVPQKDFGPGHYTGNRGIFFFAEHQKFLVSPKPPRIQGSRFEKMELEFDRRHTVIEVKGHFRSDQGQPRVVSLSQIEPISFLLLGHRAISHSFSDLLGERSPGLDAPMGSLGLSQARFERAVERVEFYKELVRKSGKGKRSKMGCATKMYLAVTTIGTILWLLSLR
jgi:hypothetical protein